MAKTTLAEDEKNVEHKMPLLTRNRYPKRYGYQDSGTDSWPAWRRGENNSKGHGGAQERPTWRQAKNYQFTD
jgi:hypothetical protein